MGSIGSFWMMIISRLYISHWITVKKRCAEGIGHVVKQAQVLSYDDENTLWNMGLLGSSNPNQLVKTLIFVHGMHCAL